MEEGLIDSTLRKLVLQGENSLSEVRDYLRMKYCIEVDERVLQKRIKKLMAQNQSVA